jgi:DnaJ-class molecular chaperone
VLSDPIARAEYDRNRPEHVKRAAAAPRPRAPGDMLWRVSGSLKALLAGGIVRRAGPDVLELFLSAAEAERGGMVTISMRVPLRCLACNGRAASCVRCGGEGAVYQLFNAWLAVPPGVPDGAMLAPTQLLRGMLHPVRFRMRVRTGA